MSKQNANGTDVPMANNKEPTESDPCILENGDSAPEDKKTDKLDDENAENYFVRFRGRVCERWGLSHRVFYACCGLVALLVILAIIVISLAAAWPRIPHSLQYPVCKDAACLRAASQIREAMNASASPCTDLWSWACGGWLQKNPLPKHESLWNQKQQLNKQEATRVRELITTLSLPLHVGSVEWKLKHLYESCLDVDNVNIDEDRPLTKMINQLGGWYILRNWNNEDFDHQKLLKELHVKHGVTPFFKISIEPEPYRPNNNIIRISPSGLGLPDKDYYFRDQDDRIQKAYKELIRDVVRYMSATRDESERFGNDIFFFEKRIAEITPNTTSLQNPTITSHYRSVSELKEIVLNIPFHDILAAMFPKANIGESTEVVITSDAYLTAIAQIISTTDMKTMNGYLIWTLVRNYLPYLNDKFTSAVDNFKAELYGIREPLKRWEVCIDLVYRFMGLEVNVLSEKLAPISNETIHIISETYRSILSVVRERVKKFKVAPQLSNQLTQKLASLQLQIGLPSKIKDISYIKSYYNDLSIIKANLFETVKNGVEFEKSLQEKQLTQPSHPEDLIIDTLNKRPPRVAYLPSSNLVVVPRALLTPAYFENKYPKAVIFGRIGVELAEAIVDAVLPYGSLWTGDKKLLTPQHFTANISLRSIEKLQFCLFKFILNLNLALPYDIANETALLTLKHISAVSVAYEALKSSLLRDHVHQPALEDYEDSAIFFLSYGQTQCSESTHQFQQYDMIVNFKLPQQSLLYVVWSQSTEFSKSFDCSPNKNLQCSGLV